MKWNKSKVKRFSFLIICLTVTVLTSCSRTKLVSHRKLEKENYELPLILKLGNDEKRLSYIGVYHTNSPNDSLITILNKEFSELQPDFILHEGNNWPIYDSLEKTIEISGEPGFIIQMAMKNAIPYSSIEPDDSLEYIHLLKKFNRQETILMYVCRQIGQQQRLAEQFDIGKDEFEKTMNDFLSYLRYRGVPMEPKEYDFDFWKQYYQRFLGIPFELSSFDPSIFYPNYRKTKLNKINRASDTFRNMHMVNQIFEKLESYDRLLVVVGGGHLVIQKRRITSLFDREYTQ